MIPGAKPEVRVFTTVFFIALVAMTLYISDWTTSNAVRATKKITNTIALADVNVGDNLGKDIPALTEFHLLGLADGVIITSEGVSTYKHFLRLTADDFKGGTVLYTADEKNAVGDYIFFSSDEPLFEYSLVFSPQLESKIEDGTLNDLEEEYITLLGGVYAVLEAEVNKNAKTVFLKLFGMGNMLEFKDNYADNSFSQGVSINGKNINAYVKIVGSISGDVFQISTITYRPYADAIAGNDVYVMPKHGLREYLQEPNVMLSPSFEMIYYGILEERIDTKPITSVNTILFKPVGDHGYKLIFTNNLGQRYSLPVADSTGTFKYGDEKRDLLYIEGANQNDFNIDIGDYFVAASKNDINGITSVIKYDRINTELGAVYFDDLAGGTKEVLYNKQSNEGTLNIAGKDYRFFVSSNSAVAFDLNGDGDIGGDEAKVVILGGANIDLGKSNLASGNEITVKFTTPSRLFDEPSGDETVNLRLFSANNEIDLEVASGVTLKKDDKSGLMLGLTDFGVFFVLDDRKEPAELTIEFPAKGQKGQFQPKLGGQAKALVVVTLEREKLLGLADSV